MAVGIGMFWFHQARLALLGFHFAIVLSLFVAKPHLPVKILFKSNNIRWILLSIILCGSSGIALYGFWSYFEVVSDLPAQIEAFGLTSSTWPLFITYFVLVNPLIEEYFWRGYLGSPTKTFIYFRFSLLRFPWISFDEQDASRCGYLQFDHAGSCGVVLAPNCPRRRGIACACAGSHGSRFSILIAVYRISV
jgi:hypothetical protein